MLLLVAAAAALGYRLPLSSAASGRLPLASSTASGLRAPSPVCTATAVAAPADDVDACLTEAADGTAADSCAISDPEYTLMRYLQLQTVLTGQPLPDATVESLIRRVEEASEPAFDEQKIWGDWQLCWQFNAKAATRSQKALAPPPQYSNFMFNEEGAKVFRNIVQARRAPREDCDGRRPRTTLPLTPTPASACAGR